MKTVHPPPTHEEVRNSPRRIVAADKGKRILILEDDPGMAELQQRRLSRLGFEVEIARSTSSAHDFVLRGDIHLMLLDYRLEEPTSGLDFYRRLLEEGHSVPAILVTGLGHEQVLSEAMRAGVRGFVLKTENYWDDLVEVVSRVDRQLDIERTVLESAAIRENEAKLEAAFEAACVGHWRWDPAADQMTFSNIHLRLLDQSAYNVSFAQFVEWLHPDDQDRVRAAFVASRNSGAALEVEYRIPCSRPQSVRWLLMRGSPLPNYTPHFASANGSEPITGVTTDVSERKNAEQLLRDSLSQIQLLNDRLRASMIETHHRVKNSLQIVGSLLNLSLRGRDSLPIEEAKKLVSHISAFATLHEILGEKNETDFQDMRTLNLRELLGKLTEVLEPLSNSRLQTVALEELRVSARQGSALGIIYNELVSNAIKYGNGAIEVAVRRNGGSGALTVYSEGANFPTGFEPEQTGRTGLVLIGTIARAELGHGLQFLNDDRGWATVEVPFPLSVSP